MDTKQIDYFLALCQTQNITEASRELFLTRQALSKSIHALEQELGIALFERTGKGVELTEAGIIIRDDAQHIKLHWKNTVERAARAKGAETIRVGAHLTHLTEECIDYLMAYQDLRPEIRISLYDHEDYIPLFKMLRENKLDIANVRKRPEGEDLNWFKTIDCDVFLMAHKDNPLMRKQSINFMKDLRGCRCFLLSHDTIVEMEPYADAAGFSLEYMTPSYLALRVALKHNRGVFFAPSINASLLADETILARKIIGYPIATTNYFVYRSNQSDTIADYLEYLRGFADLPVFPATMS